MKIPLTARRLSRLLLAALLVCTRAAAADFEGFPLVNDDGTFDLHQTTIQLYGILIPDTDQSCTLFQQPPSCAPRAALALKFNLDASYVKCDRKGRLPNGIVIAKCTADGVDPAEQLLRQGWAAALPDASPQYELQEEIAKQHGLGVWGFAVGRQGFR